MKAEVEPKYELVNLKFSDTIIISDEELKKEVQKVTVELEEITKKKQVDYEKLKAVVKL